MYFARELPHDPQLKRGENQYDPSIKTFGIGVKLTVSDAVTLACLIIAA